MKKQKNVSAKLNQKSCSEKNTGRASSRIETTFSSEDIISLAAGDNPSSAIDTCISHGSITSATCTSFLQPSALAQSIPTIVINSSVNNSTSNGDINFNNYVFVNKKNCARDQNEGINPFDIPAFSPLFKDSRKVQLEKIKSYHDSQKESKELRVFIIQGMNGIGKSQLAMKFGFLHKEYFQNRCCWIDATNPKSLANSFKKLKESLEITESNPKLIVTSVYKKLNSYGKSLIIFDNARKAKEIRSYLPPASLEQSDFFILVTSTNQKSWASHPDSLVMRCDDPDIQKDTLDYINIHPNLNERKAEEIKELAEALGYHPLAVAQATRYISWSGISISEYIKRFNNEKKEYLSEKVGKEDFYKDSAYVVFHLSLLEAAKKNNKVKEVISACAYLHPHGIERTLLSDYFTQNEKEFDNIVRIFRAYSLVDLTSSTKYFDVHKLLQISLREQLEERGGCLKKAIDFLTYAFYGEKNQKGLSDAVKLVEGNFSYQKSNRYKLKKLDSLMPHALSVVEHANRLSYTSKKLAHLLYAIGVYYLNSQYDIKKAKSCLEKSEALHKQLKSSSEIQVEVFRQLFKAYLRNAISARDNKLKDFYFNKAEEYLKKVEVLKIYNQFTLNCDWANFYLNKIEYIDNFKLDDYFKELPQLEADPSINEKQLDQTDLPILKTAKVYSFNETRHNLIIKTKEYLEQQAQLSTSSQSKTNQAMLLHYWGTYYLRIKSYDLAIEWYDSAIKLKATLSEIQDEDEEIARSCTGKADALFKQSLLSANGHQKKDLLNHSLIFFKKSLKHLLSFYKTSAHIQVKDILIKMAQAFFEVQELKQAIYCRVIAHRILTILSRADIENDRELIKLFREIARFDQARKFINLHNNEKKVELLTNENRDLNTRPITFYFGNKARSNEDYLSTDCSAEYISEILNLNETILNPDNPLKNQNKKQRVLTFKDGLKLEPVFNSVTKKRKCSSSTAEKTTVSKKPKAYVENGLVDFVTSVELNHSAKTTFNSKAKAIAHQSAKTRPLSGRNPDKLLNVSGQGNNCGLFALALGLKKALENKPQLRNTTRLPDFFDAIDTVWLKSGSDAKETIETGRKLRQEMAHVLLKDVQYKARRYQNVITVCREFLEDSPSAPDMRAWLLVTCDYREDLKKAWLSISDALEKSYLTVEADYRRFLDNSSLKLDDIARLREQFSKQIMDKPEQNVLNALLIPYQTAESDSVFALIQLKRLYRAAWRGVTIGTGLERNIVSDCMEAFFKQKALAILQKEAILVPQNLLLLLSLVEKTNFDQNGNLAGSGIASQEEVLSGAAALFVEKDLSAHWNMIYQSYCEYIKTTTEMLSADELGCLARYWCIRLKIQFAYGEPYITDDGVDSEQLLQVTLCNPTQVHWNVVCETGVQFDMKWDSSKIVPLILGIENVEYKTHIIGSINHESAYARRQEDCSYIVAVVSAIQDIPHLLLSQKGVSLSAADRNAAQELSQYFEQGFLKLNAERIYFLKDFLSKDVFETLALVSVAEREESMSPQSALFFDYNSPSGGTVTSRLPVQTNTKTTAIRQAHHFSGGGYSAGN